MNKKKKKRGEERSNPRLNGRGEIQLSWRAMKTETTVVRNGGVQRDAILIIRIECGDLLPVRLLRCRRCACGGWFSSKRR